MYAWASFQDAGEGSAALNEHAIRERFDIVDSGHLAIPGRHEFAAFVARRAGADARDFLQRC